MKSDDFFQFDVVAFGTHHSKFFGETARQIEADGFDIKYKIESLILGDSPQSIVDGMGLTMIKFSQIWGDEDYDLVMALGDRYEMFAAAFSTIAFNIPVAHISGGEQTFGAIDNSFRDALTTLSKIHFTSTEHYKARVIQIKGDNENVFNVGALNLDNLKQHTLLSIDEFKTQFTIDLSIPSILITCHPETISYQKNKSYITELISALSEIKDYQLIFTMPNADTAGNQIREVISAFIAKSNRAIGVESFGTVGYLSCMKHCSFMLGNTSSGFVEASYFPKYVINLGDRQKGRIVTPNIKNCPFDKDEILDAISGYQSFTADQKIEVYGDGTAALKIIEILKGI